ncbi:MAG: DUF1802 family protein [Tepidisphaeraceae bacterium]|jgi:hypothetical protein
MTCPNDLRVALKEWAVVCAALGSGRQIILLRKGGIYESAGEFEIEHRQFLLFPTYLHQNAAMLKDDEKNKLPVTTAEPKKIEISLAAEITDIIPMSDRAAMDALNDEHIWSAGLIGMRFNYRPENPLYLLLVRACRLARPTTIENTPAYAGCKSWVPLDRAIATQDAVPALDDAEYARRREKVLAVI